MWASLISCTTVFFVLPPVDMERRRRKKKKESRVLLHKIDYIFFTARYHQRTNCCALVWSSKRCNVKELVGIEGKGNCPKTDDKQRKKEVPRGVWMGVGETKE